MLKRGIFVYQYNIMGTITLDISAKANTAPNQSGWLVVTLGYGINHTFTLTNFTTETTPPYSDPEGDPLNEIKITSLPAQGVLKLSGTPISVNAVITSAQLSGGLFTYESDSVDVDGYSDGFMEFVVSDTGSTIFTTTPQTVTFQVAGNINQAPSSVGDAELTVGIGSTTVFTRAMLTTGLNPAYSDPENDAALNLLINIVPIYGNLYLSGVLVVTGQVVPFSEIDLGNFTYVNNSLVTGDDPELFDFSISDTGSGLYVG